MRYRKFWNPKLETMSLEELKKLPPIEIELFYFQVTGGVAFRF